MIEKTTPRYYDVTLGPVLDFGNETRHFDLVYKAGPGMDFIPGQFVVVMCPQREGKVLRRAYSIASEPEQKEKLSLVIKLVQGGVVTNWFWTLKQGDKFRVQGPFGKFVLPQPVDFDILFVATGTGIAPFRSMIRQMLPAGFKRKIRLLFGSRYDNAIPYHREFLDLAGKYPNFTYVQTISRPSPSWKGEIGYVQTKIGKLSPHGEGTRVYICGLNEMIQAVRDTCLKQGFQKEQIAYEKYD